RTAAAACRGAAPGARGRGAAGRPSLGCRDARAARTGEARASAAVAGAGGAARADGDADQHPQPALALGVVLALGAHLPELAPGADAGDGPRLRADPRADAPEAHGSLAGVLETGGGGVPGVQAVTGLAAKAECALTVLGSASGCA